MAIIIRKAGWKVYVSQTGIVTNVEKRQADRLDLEIKYSINQLEKSLIEKGLVTKKGEKKDALRIWFEFGKLLNKIGKKFKIIGGPDEEFYWRAVYDHVSSIIQKKPFPRRSQAWKVNHFRLCSLLAKRSWNEVQSVGPWSVWRDIFDNKKILEDDRVYNWTIEQISKSRKRGWDHKQIRIFLYDVSRRIRNLETSILTHKELYKKLEDVSV